MFLEKVKMLCKDKGETVGDFEGNMGFSRGAAYKWNKSLPSVGTAKKIADYFGVSLDYLMAEDGASSKFGSFYTTPEEQAIISAYRACDEMGKGMVKRILNISDDSYDTAAEIARRELEDTPVKNEELIKKDI